MLEQFLGEKTFQTGLRSYLREHSYRNATTRDLWTALEDASGLPVNKIMQSWTTQTGFPILKVNIDKHPKSLSINFEQSRFRNDNILNQLENDKSIWQIPISIYSSGSDENIQELMTHQTLTFNLNANNDDWVKVNPGHTAFYRVQYENTELEKLTHPISSLVLKPADRLGIQSDTFALAKAGVIDAKDYLNLLNCYSNENDASVWGDIASNIEYFSNLLENTGLYPKFKNFVTNIIKPSTKFSGWDPKPEESHLESLLRSTLLNLLGKFGDTLTIEESKTRFYQYLKEPTDLNPDIRLVVFSNVARSGNDINYSQMWHAHNSTQLHEEKVRLLIGMTKFNSPTILNNLLEKTLSDDVRSQDTISVISGVMGNTLGRQLGWEFIKSNWEEIDRRYGDGGFGIMRLIGNLSGFSSLDNSLEIQKFFDENPTPGAERTIRQSLESIAINHAWLMKNEDSLESWFK